MHPLLIRVQNSKVQMDSYGELRDLSGGTTESGWRILGDLFSRAPISRAEDFANLDGEFLGVVWNGESKSVAVISDKMGTVPIFYCREGGEWLFSTHASKLLRERATAPAPNMDHLARYLLQGIHPLEIQNSTLFSDIHRLPASHFARIDAAGTLTVHRYWDFDFPVRTAVSAEEAVEGFREILYTAIADRLRPGGKTAVSVSGGLDSSAVFCAASRFCDEERLHGISYISDQRDCDETSFLNDVEQQTGRKIDKFPILDHLGFSGSVAGQIAAVEAPFTDQLWGVTNTLFERARHHGCKRILTGHWGDQVLFSPAYLADLFAQGSLSDFFKHSREMPKWITAEEWQHYRKIVRRKIIKRLIPPAVPLVRWLRRLRGRQAIGMFHPDFAKRARALCKDRWPGASQSEYQSDLYLQARSYYHQDCLDWNFKVSSHFGVEMRFPLYDRRIISFLMGIPGELQNIGGRPRGILREALKGVLPESVRNRVWKSDFSCYVNQTLQAEAHLIEQILAPGALVFELGILDQKKLAKALSRVLSTGEHDDCQETWIIADLVALEIWLKTFIKGETIWQKTNATNPSGSKSQPGFQNRRSNGLDLSQS